MTPFRFGVALNPGRDPRSWAAVCQRAEELGYDTLHVPDHLDMAGPLTSLVAAAAHTERITLGTYVLNAAFSNPLLLAREAVTVDRLAEHRLELGLGAGYVRSEFDRAGIDWTTRDERLAHLERTCTAVRAAWPGGRRPRLLVGGGSIATLRLAVRLADVVSLTPGARVSTTRSPRLYSAAEFDERVQALRQEGQAANCKPELNLLVHRVEITEDPARAAAARRDACGGEALLLTDLPPTVLTGSVEDVAKALLAHRDRYGFTYFTVREDVLEDFAPVVAALVG